MFSRVRGFLSRHKRKLLVGSVVIGGILFLTHYTQRKIREWQEKEIKELLERIKHRQYFESTEKSCNRVIQTCATTLRESIVKALNTEAIVNRLRLGYADKLAAWNELKVLAITRSAVVIYSQVMLVTLIKIQFNLMGGHRYKDLAQATNSVTDKGYNEMEYLSLCNYFLNEGINKLCNLIEEKVKEITASISLKNELSLRDLEQIYWAIMSSVSADNANNPMKNLADYMLPGNCENGAVNVSPKLVTETLDLLESAEVQNLSQSNVQAGFVLLMDHISEYFTNTSKTSDSTNTQNGMLVPRTSGQNDAPSADTTTSQFNHRPLNNSVDIHKFTMPMAKIIPIINGQVPDKPTPRDVPSDWLQRLIMNEELRTLGGNIYEAFSF